MKKAMKFVIAMAMVLLMSGGAMAEGAFVPQGSVVVPNIESHKNSYSWSGVNLNITNISNDSVQCRVIFYDHDGIDVGTHTALHTGSPSGGQTIGQGNSVFEIPAHGTRVVSLNVPSGAIFGHAIVEWKSNDPRVRKALVAGAYALRADGSSVISARFLINNGQPF